LLKSTFLVTGGAGFIGSNIAESLLRSGHSVKVLDNFLTGDRENLSFVKELPDDERARFELIEGDIRDRDIVAGALIGVDYVLHQAALPSVVRSVEDPVMSNDININGTLNILQAAKKNGSIKKIVYAASSSAYGDTPTLPKVETMPPNPLSPYALQKYAGEEYLKIYSSLFGVKTVSLRYFNVFGPRQSEKSLYAAVIPNFISAFIKGEAPVVYGDGEQTRDFTYIENVVQANLNAAFSSDETNGMVFNIACGSCISLNELLKLLENIFDKSANAKYEPERQGDVKHSLADITLAEKYLQYQPDISFTEGIKRTVDYFLKSK
jgi:UDP-glucose 4-epimerase